MLLRLARLGITNTLALLRLPPMSGQDRDAEILVLRHQITVLERHLRPETVLRWHPDLIRRRHAAHLPPQAGGRTPTVRSVRDRPVGRRRRRGSVPFAVRPLAVMSGYRLVASTPSMELPHGPRHLTPARP